ncbi:outer membrane protein [Fontimonas thermophila]|uniref:Outer membrane protein n=1 Tax=Fontimonas thermophila TaxID=1076937 RepID=A0A1I2J3C8_9GAMM|nr:TolC family outer membrane protein [Fontimonas thermophila]SFF49232.1 outer membrane protein [Fontimonas thermophila]
MHLLRGSLLAAILVLPGWGQAHDLMRVYDLALRNDASLRAARHARDAALEAHPQARAALLPQLTGAYSYGYADTDGTYQFNEPRLDPNTGELISREAFHFDGTDRGLSITLNQPLFDLASWRRLQQAASQVALAHVNYRNAEQDLILRVAQAYFGVLGARDNLRSAQAEKAAVERQLEQARRRFEVGLSAITDVQEAQARYDLTVATELEAQQRLAAAQEALAEITQQKPDETAALREDIPLPAPEPDDVERWVAFALDGNLELLAARLDYDIAARGVQVARAGHLPTLGLRGTYEDGDSESRSVPTNSEGTSVALNLSVPLFSGGATQSGVRQAIATREQRRAQQEGTARRIERTTRDAYQAVITGAARVRAFKQAVISNTTALEASEAGLEVGTRTAVDVLNTQQQLYGAQRNYLQSRYDYLLAVLRLKAVAGQLTAADLAEIDRLLTTGQTS